MAEGAPPALESRRKDKEYVLLSLLVAAMLCCSSAVFVFFFRQKWGDKGIFRGMSQAMDSMNVGIARESTPPQSCAAPRSTSRMGSTAAAPRNTSSMGSTAPLRSSAFRGGDGPSTPLRSSPVRGGDGQSLRYQSLYQPKAASLQLPAYEEVPVMPARGSSSTTTTGYLASSFAGAGSTGHYYSPGPRTTYQSPRTNSVTLPLHLEYPSSAPVGSPFRGAQVRRSLSSTSSYRTDRMPSFDSVNSHLPQGSVLRPHRYEMLDSRRPASLDTALVVERMLAT